jgi:hypothetical protein
MKYEIMVVTKETETKRKPVSPSSPLIVGQLLYVSLIGAY